MKQTENTMLRTIEEYIKEQRMLEVGDHIVLGVSGGADSVALLLILQELSVKWHFTLHVVHVNHMLRGEDARRDQYFVQELCKKLLVDCRVVCADVASIAEKRGESLEEAGRRVRYEAFAQRVRELSKQENPVARVVIAVAHHANDQAETILHHLVRGSSLKGAGGMRPVHDGIIRPLLGVTRLQIEAYLDACGQDYCEDRTNESTAYVRNRFRLDVIPYIEKYINAGVVENVCDLARDLAESYALIHKEAEELLKQCRKNQDSGQENLAGGTCVELMLEPLKKADGILRREALMLAVQEVSGEAKDLTRRHVEAVEKLIFNQVSKQVDLPYEVLVRRGYDTLILKKKSSRRSPGEWFLNCSEEDFVFSEEIFDGNWENITNDYTKVFDYDTIKSTLKLRKRLPGDYFVLDHTGKRKLLKNYFIDEKVPAQYRDRIWLLAEESHVLWIVGYRMSAAYKVNSSTSKVLKVTIRRKDNGVSDRT